MTQENVFLTTLVSVCLVPSIYLHQKNTPLWLAYMEDKQFWHKIHDIHYFSKGLKIDYIILADFVLENIINVISIIWHFIFEIEKQFGWG